MYFIISHSRSLVDDVLVLFCTWRLSCTSRRREIIKRDKIDYNFMLMPCIYSPSLDAGEGTVDGFSLVVDCAVYTAFCLLTSRRKSGVFHS